MVSPTERQVLRFEDMHEMLNARHPNMMKLLSKQLCWVFALWTFVAIVEGSADSMLRSAAGLPSSFLINFKEPLLSAYIWAVLTPAILAIAHRAPLLRAPIARNVFVHSISFVLFSVLHCFIANLLLKPVTEVFVNYHGQLFKLLLVREIYNDMWMYWPLVCIQGLLDSQRQIKDRELQAVQLSASLTTSQLALLRAQIQPHFLFNTLHAITALLRTDARAAEDMTADLAEILRSSFANIAQQEVRLAHELELVQCYLRIQERRFSDRLRIDLQIEKATLNAAVPALVLQSFVENAVIHGIAQMTRVGTIRIESSTQDQRLVISVRDNGNGFGSQAPEGIGIANSRERLKHLYGANQSIQLHSDTTGTCVTLSIPFRTVPE